MTAKWLALHSLQRNQTLLKYINMLSMHFRLLQAGYESDIEPKRLSIAQASLSEFLTLLANGLEQTDQNISGVIHGADPRFQTLVESYKQKQQDFSSALRDTDISWVQEHLNKNEAEHCAQLVAYLDSLRNLIEKQISEDTANV
jgi:hypothetical protein